MASFADIVASSQAYAAPAQHEILSRSKEKETGRVVKKEKTKQINELMELMEAQMRAAQKKKKGFFEKAFGGDIARLLDSDIVRMAIGSLVPFGGLATSLISGMEAGNQAKSQKDALKDIINDPRYSKYKGSYLANPVKGFKTEVQDLRSQINPGLSALTSFGTQFAMQKMMSKGAEAFKGAGADLGWVKGDGVFKNIGTNIKDFTNWEKGAGLGNLKTLLTDTDAVRSLRENIVPEGKGFKDLIKDISTDDLKKMSKDLPSLLALIQGGGDEDVPFDQRSYFTGMNY